MNKEKAIDALIACAENEVGYLEKKSNSQLDVQITLKRNASSATAERLFHF